jgi:cytochrome c oxidase subunit 1
MFVGFWITFMPQYLLGLHGMPRRIAEYSESTGWTGLNRVSTAGAYLLFIAVAIMIVNVYVSWRRPIQAPANPWDGHTLEWATSSPPPHHNFYRLPPIRSERPLWDFNHPEHTVRKHEAELAAPGEARGSGGSVPASAGPGSGGPGSGRAVGDGDGSQLR